MINIQTPILFIIIPCYNEELVIKNTYRLFLNCLTDMISDNLINSRSGILYVDDGSKDNTWDIIVELSKLDNRISGISQSKNRGHQNALLAGLMEVKNKCDITITIDCDGQDDVEAMKDMVKEYLNGCEIVYGVRKSRKTDSFFKRRTAHCYYRLLSFLGVDVIYNHADYRLVSSKVLHEFANFKEVNLYLRGMFPLVGFRSTSVYYERHERMAGKTHYSLLKMIALALDGITSFTIRPIRLISGVGLIISILSFISVVWSIIESCRGNAIEGWTSVISTVGFLGGIQLICMGILGEYIAKIYLEVKRRPRYIISKRTKQ